MTRCASTERIDMIQWKRIDGGAFVGRLPGLRLGVRPSYFRYACSDRWGWIICSESGKLIAKSPITRHSSSSLAIAGALRHVRQYMPDVWQAAIASDG